MSRRLRLAVVAVLLGVVAGACDAGDIVLLEELFDVQVFEQSSDPDVRAIPGFLVQNEDEQTADRAYEDFVTSYDPDVGFDDDALDHALRLQPDQPGHQAMDAVRRSIDLDQRELVVTDELLRAEAKVMKASGRDPIPADLLWRYAQDRVLLAAGRLLAIYHPDSPADGEIYRLREMYCRVIPDSLQCT